MSSLDNDDTDNKQGYGSPSGTPPPAFQDGGEGDVITSITSSHGSFLEDSTKVSICIHPSILHLYIYLSINLSIQTSIYISIYLFVYLSIYLYIYPSIHPSSLLSIHPSIHPSIHISTYTYIYQSFYLFIYSFIFYISIIQNIDKVYLTGNPNSSFTRVEVRGQINNYYFNLQ